MPLTDTFYNCVSSGDVLSVRIMMEDSLLVDKTFEEFADMEKAAENMTGLYDKHDGAVFNTDRTSWNDDYISEIRVDAIHNFSHERIAHLKEVVRYLYPVSEKSAKSTQSSRTRVSQPYKPGESEYQRQKREDQLNGRYIGQKVAVGAVAGAAAGTVAALILDAPLIVGGVIGAAVGGGITAAVTAKGGK